VGFQPCIEGYCNLTIKTVKWPLTVIISFAIRCHLVKNLTNVGILIKNVNFVLMKTQKRFFNTLSQSALALAALLFVSLTVFAVDGIVSKSKSSKAAYSNMKKNLSLNLSSGYTYRENRSFGNRKTGKDHSLNSIITYQKGNITYVLPYKTKSVLHRFKTPVKPQQ
jgi:hypothetical protein